MEPINAVNNTGMRPTSLRTDGRYHRRVAAAEPAAGAEADTRTRLIRAAAFHFARKGTSGARNHEIHAMAGLRNESALHYYFGNRRNLVNAVVGEYDVFAGQAADSIPGDTPEAVVDYVVGRLDSALATPDGRNWLRVISELMAQFTDQPGMADDAERATTLAARLEPMVALPAAVVHRRTFAMLRFMTSQMAERASQLEHDDPPLLDQAEFIDEVAAMSLAMLTTPMHRRARLR
jgi:AcrR family transcriptional regulator